MTPPENLGEVVATWDYHDEEGNVLFQVVRFHPKAFRQRHPGPDGAWVWNLRGVTPVLYRLPELLAADPEWVFVVEGEKDVDKLRDLGLVATTNPMGAGKWRDVYSLALQGRRVAIIPDNDDAGLKHANQVARSIASVVRQLRIVRLPGLTERGDVSDWLDAGGTPEGLAALLNATSDHAGNATENGHHPVEDLANTEVIWAGSRLRPISRSIIDRLLTHGYFITAEGRFYFFDDATKILSEINEENFEIEVLLNERYNINSTENLYKFLIRDMRVAATKGARAQVRQYAHYDPMANVLFLDTGLGQMLRLDGCEIRQADNGSDGVLFTAVPSFTPWTYLPDATPGEFAKVLIKPLNFVTAEDTPHTAEEQRLLLLLWLLAIPFESIQPTKPLALALGPAGSGKSSIFRRIGKLLFGPGFDVDGLRRDTKGEEDFFVATTNRPFVAWDNVDRYIPWLDDALATSATGMRVTKRVMRTTNTMASYTPRAFIALTARTPRFRREDVAERLLIFHLDKLHEKRPEYELIQEVVQRRDSLLSDYARLLNRVVAAPEPSSVDTTIRLADFAKVAVRIGAGLGVAESAQSAVENMKRAQWMYATEENDVAILLDAWISSKPAEEMDMGLDNQGRVVTSTRLFEELKAIAESRGLRWRYNSAVALGRQIMALEEPLSIYFRFERRHGKTGTTWTFHRAVDGEAMPWS